MFPLEVQWVARLHKGFRTLVTVFCIAPTTQAVAARAPARLLSDGRIVAECRTTVLAHSVPRLAVFDIRTPRSGNWSLVKGGTLPQLHLGGITLPVCRVPDKRQSRS